MVKRYGAGTMAAVVAVVVMWSTTFAALVAALGHFTPHHLLFLRWTLTALLFAGFGFATRMRLPRREDLPLIALAGFLGFGAYQLLLVTGQAKVSATMAGFLINMSPIFTTLIASATGRERMTWATWGGLAACVAGLVLMADAKGGLNGIGPSAGLIVLAALSFSLYTLVSKPLLARYRPLEVTTYSVIAGSLPFLAFARGSLAELATATPADIATLVFLATVPGGLSYVLWSRAVKGLTPGLAARFLYVVPVIGVLVAWAWVGEAPRALTVLGGIVTVAGVGLASMNGRPRAATLVLDPRGAAEAA